MGFSREARKDENNIEINGCQKGEYYFLYCDCSILWLVQLEIDRRRISFRNSPPALINRSLTAPTHLLIIIDSRS